MNLSVVEGIPSVSSFGVVTCALAFIGGLVFLRMPFTPGGRKSPQWVRTAIWILAPITLCWSLLGFVMMVAPDRLSPDMRRFFYDIMAMFSGSVIGILFLLFISGEFLKTRRPKVSGLLAVLLTVSAICTTYLLSPKPARSIWSQVAEAMRKSEYNKAHELAQGFVNEHPDDYHAHESLGNIDLAMGDSAGAEAEYTRAYELLPSEEIAKHLEAIRRRRQHDGSTQPSPSVKP